MNAQYLLAAVDKAIEDAQDRDHRKHLGASVIGDDCARKLWFGFRWAKKELFDGRMLRLFERGQLEEPRFVAFLEATGATVQDKDPSTGKQWRISDVDGHFGGSTDGVAVNLPQLPLGLECVLEMKTHSDDSFTKLAGKLVSKWPRRVRKDPPGLRVAQPKHFIQLQTYMRKLKITVGLYLAVNKDSDEIYAEFVALEPEVGDRAIERAARIIHSAEAPARISNSPGWFACKFCSFAGICHQRDTPEVNCRTCAHSTPGPEGTWVCARGNSDAVALQRGCPHHLFNPYLLNIVRVERGDTQANWLELVRLDGSTVVTGPDYTPSDKLEL